MSVWCSKMRVVSVRCADLMHMTFSAVLHFILSYESAVLIFVISDFVFVILCVFIICISLIYIFITFQFLFYFCCTTLRILMVFVFCFSRLIGYVWNSILLPSYFCSIQYVKYATSVFYCLKCLPLHYAYIFIQFHFDITVFYSNQCMCSKLCPSNSYTIHTN